MAAPLFVDCYNRHPCCDTWSDNGELRGRRFPLPHLTITWCTKAIFLNKVEILVENLTWCTRATFPTFNDLVANLSWCTRTTFLSGMCGDEPEWMSQYCQASCEVCAPGYKKTDGEWCDSQFVTTVSHLHTTSAR